MERLNHFITTGSDIIIDLRKNNRRCPKFDEFWEVVAAFIEEKTAVNDRRHNNSDGEGELVLNFAIQLTDITTFASIDAKCKVPIGEPGFPIAAVSRGKQVIVGCNQSFQVGDHDFLKLSFIPGGILIHDIPNEDKGEQSEEDESNSEGEDNLQIKTTMGEWYRGQVFYGIKSMASEGSNAWRGVTELGNTLKDHHDTIPERVYIYADGGGDRRITYLQVQMGLIAKFLCYDLDELISARPATGCSY